MNRGYDRHNSLGDRSEHERPIPTRDELENPKLIAHYPPQTIGDKFAYAAVEALKPLTHAFFRDKYNHHAVVLETVAAVPGMVGGAFRHLRSLRRMQRDNGWIHPLWEEAENERMHLLIWMQVTKPTWLEKSLVVAAQSFYGLAYTAMYFFRPQVAHRFVGYLEEEAVAAYTSYLRAIDSGALPNLPAPEIAKRYYRLPADATIRDVILYVRIDECMHRYAAHPTLYCSISLLTLPYDDDGIDA
jgi:ubiquinol oxidase